MAKVQVLALRPTQFALGLREVQAKVEKIRALSKDERHEYMHDHSVPVVLAPDAARYLIDHHHLVRAAWESGVIDEVVTELKADLTKLAIDKFWDQMKKQGWVYLHDQFGKGPHPPELLPVDVRGMADDPF